MSISRTFAIDGTPEAIWDALWSDLNRGDRDSVSVESSHWPTALALRVYLGGTPAILSYAIEASDGQSLVTATLEPTGLRYLIHQLLTFGHTRTNYAMLLTIGLSNLKQAVEGTSDSTE